MSRKQKTAGIFLTLLLAVGLLFCALPVYAAPTAPTLPELTESKPQKETSSAPAKESHPAMTSEPEDAVSSAAEAAPAGSGPSVMLIVGISAWGALLGVAIFLIILIIRRKKRPPGSRSRTEAELARKDEKFGPQHYRRY